ncbi:apolipoprotein L3-like [Suricata suricatta]|nr:apolipoprotein L3-like [Suricata suricatta]
MLLKRLRALEEVLYKEEIIRLQSDPLERKHFLNVFPQLKQELEDQIRKLRKLADKADEVHRNCTFANLVASSTGAASGVLTLLGLGLAPVTSGVSLTLCAPGMGLGTVSAVTGVCSSLVEHLLISPMKGEASQLTSTASDKGKGIARAMYQNIPQNISLKDWAKVVQTIAKNVFLIKLAEVNPHLKACVERLLTEGRVPVPSGKQVQNAIRVPLLTMTRGARFMSAATAGIFLWMDVANIVEESKHLQEGAKAESAEELRHQIKLLESKLKELIQTHERLKKT